MNRFFWRLGGALSLDNAAEWDGDKNKIENIYCSLTEEHRRGGKRLADLSIVLPHRAVQDFVWTWYSECLIQDNVLELFKSSNFSGFDVKQVRARFKNSTDQPPTLWELVLTGWGGVADPSSGIQLDIENSCDVCGHLRYTEMSHPDLLIDDSKWDGSDFFMVWPLPRYVFVTERVVRTIHEHNLAGARLIRASDMEPTEGGFSPGRLSYWMPEARAKSLGEPLGIY